MIFVTADEIPLITVWNRLPDDEATVVLMIVEVADFPFTVEVKVFAAEVKTLVVVESNPTIELVDITPLTFVVTTPPA